MVEHRRRTLVRCGRLIDGTGQPSIRDAAILIDGSDIVAVGPASSILKLPEAADAIESDFSAHSVMPGLIDGHVHVAWGTDTYVAWPGARTDTDLLMAWSIASAQSALCAGITTMRDCGAPHGITLKLRRAISEGTVICPHLQVCGPAITTTGGHGEFIGTVADSADELRKVVRTLCRQGVDFIKVMATGGSADAETNRRRAQYSGEELQAAVDDAHRLRRQVVAHGNATEGIRNAVAAGVDIIAHCNWLGVEDGTIEYDPAVARAMADRGVFVDLNIEGAFRPFPTGDGWAQDWTPPEAPANRWELMDAMRQVGVPIFFTSDNFGPEIARFPQLLVEAARQGEIGVEELIWRATGLAADAIGLGDQLGTIVAGKRADLLCVEGEVTEDLEHLLDVRAVYLAGQPVVKDGWLAAQVPHAVGSTG